MSWEYLVSGFVSGVLITSVSLGLVLSRLTRAVEDARRERDAARVLAEAWETECELLRSEIHDAGDLRDAC